MKHRSEWVMPLIMSRVSVANFIGVMLVSSGRLGRAVSSTTSAEEFRKDFRKNMVRPRFSILSTSPPPIQWGFPSVMPGGPPHAGVVQMLRKYSKSGWAMRHLPAELRQCPWVSRMNSPGRLESCEPGFSRSQASVGPMGAAVGLKP